MAGALGILVALQVAASPVPREIGDLSFMVGSWAGSVQGANVRYDVEKGPGARSLKSELSVSGSLIRTFRDEGFIWWDDVERAYRSHAMSSVSNEPRKEIGRITSGTLVMVSEPFEVDGRSERARRSFAKEGDGLRFELHARDGNAWKKQISTLLKRRK